MSKRAAGQQVRSVHGKMQQHHIVICRSQQPRYLSVLANTLPVCPGTNSLKEFLEASNQVKLQVQTTSRCTQHARLAPSSRPISQLIAAVDCFRVRNLREKPSTAVLGGNLVRAWL